MADIKKTLVKLVTSDDRFIVCEQEDLAMSYFIELPKVVLWGQRVFFYDLEADTPTHRVVTYKEVFSYAMPYVFPKKGR